MAQVHKTARVLGFMFWAGFGGFGSLFWVSGSTPCFTFLHETYVHIQSKLLLNIGMCIHMRLFAWIDGYRT